MNNDRYNNPKTGIRSVSLGSLILAMCFAAGTAFAEKENQKDNLIVTGTRTVRAAHELPLTINRIDLSEDVMQSMPRTMPEAFNYLPAVMVQKTGHGQGSPYIRGFTGYRTLFLVDGIRLNNSVWRDGPNQYWNTVDIYSTDRIELVKGPSSTLYGSDSLGGTSNALTKNPVQSGWDPLAYYRYSSAEDSNTLRGQVNGAINEHWGLIGGISLKDFGNLETAGIGTNPETGYEQYDWDAKLAWAPNARQRWTLAHYGTRIDDAWRTHKTVFGRSWRGTTVGDEKQRSLDQSRSLTYLGYDQDLDATLADNLQATVSYQEQDEERQRIRSNDRWDIQGFDVDTIGVALQIRKEAGAHSIAYGFEFYRDDVSSFKRGLAGDMVTVVESIQGPVADDATYRTYGLYAEDEITFTDRYALIAGLRYNLAEAEADKVQDPVTGTPFSIEDDWSRVVGNLRLRAFLDDAQAWQMFAGISQGYRAPNLSDLTRFDSARSNEFEVPSPDLDAEKLVSYEIGTKYSSATAGFGLSYFYSDIDDLIVRTPTGRVINGETEITKKNAGNGYVTGVEIDGHYLPFENWLAWANFTWLDSSVETFPTSAPQLVSEPIDRQMPITINGGIKWSASNQRIRIEGWGTWADDADELSTRDSNDTDRIPPGGTPDYFIVGIRGSWQALDSIRMSLAVENILDEEYRVHGSGLNGPGRNVIIAVQATF